MWYNNKVTIHMYNVHVHVIIHTILTTLYAHVIHEKSGGPEQKGILWTAVSSLLAAVQHNYALGSMWVYNV